MLDHLADILDEYGEIDPENYRSDNTKALLHKYENMVDLRIVSRNQNRDKCDRATTDHALDRRSLSIIYKMISQGEFNEVSGCISTGKEANVYLANSPNGDLAIKLYMTSILPFKSRSKYVEGDFRMRHGYSTCSSWKLVSKWAEKEYRNLIRITKAGTIPAPLPIKLKGVVLLMTLIGKNGYPAPKLKDVASGEWSDFGPPPDWSALYQQILENIRTLFQKCRLVHADLSEYNILYMDGKAWLIDVSQAVEHECEQALFFLRNDCYNVNAFFRRQGVNTLTLREFFEWVVDPTLPMEIEDARTHLSALLTLANERGFNQTLEMEDDAFRKVFVARKLEDVKRYFSDFKRLKMGLIRPEDLYYTTVTGVRPGIPGNKAADEEKKNDCCENVQKENNEKSDEDGTLDESDHSTEDGEKDDDDNHANESNGDGEKKDVSSRQSNRRPRDESPESRRLRKKAVQAAKAEKRLTKIPKHLKKRATKAKS